MRLILSLILLFLSLAYAQADTVNPDGTTTVTREPGAREAAEARRLEEMRQRLDRGTAPLVAEGSSTRAAQGCTGVEVSQGTLSVCQMTVGGAAGNTPVYTLNGEEFNGRVRRRSNGSYELISIETLSTRPLQRPNYTGEALPSQFSCGSQNTNELQCLVCSCFFEARGSSFPEQLRVARTKHSRVLNPRFPSSVCENVYYRHPGGGAAYSWTTANNSYNSASGPMNPRDVRLGEGSADLAAADLNSFRSCAQSSSESLHYRDQYFASYYWTKSLENNPGWIAQCRSNTEGLSGNLISGVTDSDGNRIEFDHNFRRVCEQGEISLARSDSTPLVSPRPRPRPNSGPRSIN